MRATDAHNETAILNGVASSARLGAGGERKHDNRNRQHSSGSRLGRLVGYRSAPAAPPTRYTRNAHRTETTCLDFGEQADLGQLRLSASTSRSSLRPSPRLTRFRGDCRSEEPTSKCPRTTFSITQRRGYAPGAPLMPRNILNLLARTVRQARLPRLYAEAAGAAPTFVGSTTDTPYSHYRSPRPPTTH